MDYFPLAAKKDAPTLPDGVAVLYEKGDVIGMIDMLDFMESFKVFHRKTNEEIPGIFIGEEYAESEILLEKIKKVFPSGSGTANFEFVIQVMDGHRDFFTEYMDHLDDLILSDEKEPEEDTDHPLYDTYDMFCFIEIEFFPPMEEMN